MWPKNDAHDQSLEELVTQWTLAKCGKKWCPLLEDFVSLWTLTKCGQNCAPRWRTLSRSGLCPNVIQNVPLVGGLCLTADFDQMWSKMCPSLEDFVSLRTLTRCGLNMCPLSEDFVTLQTLTKCGPNMCPLTEDFVLLRSSNTYGSTTYSSSKNVVPSNQVSKHQSTRNWNRHLWLHCHMINTLDSIPTNKPWQKKWRIFYPSRDKWQMKQIAHNHHQYSTVLNERGKHSSYRIYMH